MHLRAKTTLFIALLTLVSFVTSNTVRAVPVDYSFFNQNKILLFDPNDQGNTSCTGGATTAAGGLAGSVTTLTGKDNEEKIFNYLIASGLSTMQAAGVLSNISTESGGTFSPTVNEFGKAFGDAGYGIVQWTDSRRTTLVTSLKKSIPDIMTKYYNVNYSTQGGGIGTSSSSYTTAADGYIPKNATTGTSMGVADNDAFLLAELNFLVTETKNRTVNPNAVSRIDAGNYQGMTEWKALLQQTSTASASNLWVYSFEVPADIDATAGVRAATAAQLFAKYSTTAVGCAAAGGGAVNGSKVEIAKQILATGNMTCWDEPTNTTCKIIKDIANGSNNGNDLPCGMSIVILKMIAAITENHKITINSSNRGCSDDVGGNKTEVSRHYAGNGSALDLGPIDGISPYSIEGAKLIISLIKPYLVPNSTVGQVTNLPGGKPCSLPSSVIGVPDSIRRIPDECSHLHVDVPADADPPLKCRIPINYGGCENT